MKKNYLNFLLICLTLFAPFFVHADEWRIGLLLCLSGDCAADGDAALKGAQMAVSDLNQAGGVLHRKVALVVEDTNEAISGAKAVSAYRKLRLTPDIHYFIGPTWTPGGLAVAPIVSKDSDVIMTSPSLGVKEFHEAGENLFNTHGSEEISTRTLAQLALKNGWKRVVIWSSQQPWEAAQGVFFEDEIKKGGGEVIFKIESLPTITKLDAEALKTVKAKPDAVLFSVINQQAIAAKALKRLGYQGPMIAVYVDETRLKESEGALEGTIFGRMALPTPPFIQEFKARYPNTLSIEPPAGIAYDTVMMYAKAVEKEKTFDATKASSALLSMRHDGASGHIEFDEKGGARRRPEIMQIRDGKEVGYTNKLLLQSEDSAGT